MENPRYSLDLELIKKKAISGVVTFTLRTFFIQIFSYIAVFVLTIILDEPTYGIYVFVSALINIFVYFSDIGLAAALIQKKEELNQKDLSTTFTIQQTIVAILVLLGLIFSKTITDFYNLDNQGLWLVRILIFSLLLSSLKTIPSIILERGLNFTKLVIPQVAENIVFYTTAVVLAILGFGITSFTWAVLARGIAGLMLIYILAPWKPSFSFDKNIAKKLTSFGIPFQLNSIIALLKDDLLVVVLGKILTFGQIGYIGWSQKFAFLPLRFFMDSVNKVTFPAYSRLQEHKQELGKAIEKSLFFVTYLVYPSVFGITAIAPKLIEVIPKYQKWIIAMPAFNYFLISSFLVSLYSPIMSVFNSLGKVKTSVKFMLLWIALNWTVVPLLIGLYNYTGVGMAFAINSLGFILVWYKIRQFTPVDFLASLKAPAVSALVMFLAIRVIQSLVSSNLYQNLFITILVGLLSYSFSVLFLTKGHFLNEIKELLQKKTD